MWIYDIYTYICTIIFITIIIMIIIIIIIIYFHMYEKLWKLKHEHPFTQIWFPMVSP